ncbi:mechanosensitive ion channel, partial [Draconibacterium sp.]|nr:mechanosensitive ion channel [Draconibacterium sp.]
LLLIFYFYNHWAKLVLLPILILAISIYLKVLKDKYKKAGLYQEFKYPIQIFRHPIATATLISITIYQFFLPLPPFALTGMLWFISGIALTIVFYRTENKFVFNTWMVFFLLNLFALFDHLILIHTVAESWLILILSVSAFGFGIYTIVHRNNFDNKPKIWIITGMVILELFSISFLLLGNYNTGKIFLSEGLYAILVGYLLINTFRLSRNIFSFSDYLKESDEEKKLDTLKNRPNKISIPSFIFFFVGWVVLVTRNSYIYQKSAEPFKDALSEIRQIGEFTFTYEGIITFFLVLFLSGFISKIVSFLADDKRVNSGGSKSSGLGSWLLLVRIGIITAGIVIAFRSAGFPTDRLTMIISALGVGIGFGLQTLVNNLVSGIIIAFEKPVNLDDIVEIGGQAGKMKSIGIRSSVISTWDGSDVIIPNGDLLNQHLVNWTLGSNKRRTEIQVGVAYDTDLEKTKSLITEVLSKDKQVLKNPHPAILFTRFNDSSIDVSIKYWIGHFIYGHDIKSNLIMAIDKVFKENGIVIPFPQRDIHIQSDIVPPKDEEIEK